MGWKSKNTYSFDSESTKESLHSNPFYIGLLVIVLLTGLFGVVIYLDSLLPSAIVQENKDYTVFNAQRASKDVLYLTQLGPRIVGSHENEQITYYYLMNRINDIIYTRNKNQNIEIDVQEVSGAYSFKRSEGFINTYYSVKNIIVKFHGINSTNSVLVNSHFDSAPTSPGGSDDGINVAVMLEILKIFSQQEETPWHNIIFLFNGAEESPLLASHGFITQHKWAKDCKVVVNLDAAGYGGKIILFQTGPETPWLVKYYSNVPHPYGQAAGEEIFQSGIIPSDTDFRIFRDFGGLVGLDMAFIKDGYRYHTSYDDGDFPLGSYQHAGDNVLSLLKDLANSPELYDKIPSEGKSVYFDVFGLFFVNYTTTLASAINIVAIGLSLVVFIYSFIKFKLGLCKYNIQYFCYVLGAILGSWLLCVIFVFSLGMVLDLLGKSMSWYANPWLLYGLYVIPTVAISGSLLFLTNHQNVSLGIRSQIQANCLRLIWTIVVAFGVYFNIRATYAIMIPVVFNSLAFFTIYLLRLEYSIKTWQWIYLLFNILPCMNLMYQAVTTLSLFVPITGRMGSHRNPELLMGLMTFFFTILIVSPITIFTNTLRKVKFYFITLGIIFMAFLVVVFTPWGFPYNNTNGPHPQRHWILHTSRQFFNGSGELVKKDSGYFLLNMDRNSPNILRSHVMDLNRASPVNEYCEKYPACGLPLSHPLMLQIVDYSTWIPASQLILKEVNFTVNSIEKESPSKLIYNVSCIGPDRMTVYLVPKSNVTVQNISLVQELYTPQHQFRGRPMYFILYQATKDNLDFQFTFTVEVPDNWDGPTVDFVVIGRYAHDKRYPRTPPFLNFLSQFPTWTDKIAWLSTYQAYVI
ncbi:hypothetical protein GWI33_000031 [Rhynchophorus ferrugineus]|uniref:FXNA-like protease n=1 Tax=Rhynchophorus ferrugineus TaxID=354439 RepID=A0A834MM93_RHYFE|nr:hypothetical protein GWI33_000031 [Rhynchophorus ferrugineus]